MISLWIMTGGWLYPQNQGQGYTVQLVPSVVSVGDRARVYLTVPNPTTIPPERVDLKGPLPKSPDLVLFRVELVPGNKFSTILIDFAAYRPGNVLLPPLIIGPFTLKNVSIPIASVLSEEKGDLVLAPYKHPLWAPGTVLFLSLVGGGALLTVGLLIGIPTRGPVILLQYREARKRKKALLSLQRLVRALATREFLDVEDCSLLVQTLRIYLRDRAEWDCFALTTREIKHHDKVSSIEGLGDPLVALFSLSDKIRFGDPQKKGVSPNEILPLVNMVMEKIENWRSNSKKVLKVSE
ncbi:MAG: hypothetical protein N2Z76_00150 [Treponemataceae bacterium]|nr:hypothetical protein [Treponemataceae bacterium]